LPYIPAIGEPMLTRPPVNRQNMKVKSQLALPTLTDPELAMKDLPDSIRTFPPLPSLSDSLLYLNLLIWPVAVPASIVIFPPWLTASPAVMFMLPLLGHLE
jgi:hypothetical protein